MAWGAGARWHDVRSLQRPARGLVRPGVVKQAPRQRHSVPDQRGDEKRALKRRVCAKPPQRPTRSLLPTFGMVGKRPLACAVWTMAASDEKRALRSQPFR